jgi:hypothetical protein
MTFVILAAGCLGALTSIAVVMGIRIGAAVRDQFDELLPQRMVDFSGFVIEAKTND